MWQTAYLGAMYYCFHPWQLHLKNIRKKVCLKCSRFCAYGFQLLTGFPGMTNWAEYPSCPRRQHWMGHLQCTVTIHSGWGTLNLKQTLVGLSLWQVAKDFLFTQPEQQTLHRLSQDKCWGFLLKTTKPSISPADPQMQTLHKNYKLTIKISSDMNETDTSFLSIP